jgi:hypothetical protein
LFFAALEENGSRVFPSLSFDIDYTESFLEDEVIKLRVQPESSDVTFFGVEKIIVEVVSMASEDPGCNVVLLLCDQFIKKG